MVELVVRRASGRLDQIRGAIAASIRSGPASIVPLVLATLLVAAGAAVLILTVVPASGEQPALNEWVRGVAAGICALAGIAFLTYQLRRSARSTGRHDSSESDQGVVTMLLSAAVLALLLLIPVYLLAARTHPPTERWIGYGFFDKRWLVATFLLGTIGALIVITAVSRVVAAAAKNPATWRSWVGASCASVATPAPGVSISSISLRRALLLTGAGVGLAAYFFAPPWHPSLTAVNIHEMPMMAGVQGIANGATPYIDSAAFQYGPGAELIHYLYANAFGFNIENLRESTVVLFWLAATIFFVVVLIRIPPKLAVITCLVAILVFPTLQMVSFQPNGAVDATIDRLEDSSPGVWGWPNGLRYIGVLAAAMLFPAVATMMNRRLARLAGIALGLLFGLCCLASQENLIGGLLAIGVLSLLLILSQTVPARMIGRALLATGIGFGVIVVAVFGYYAFNGHLGRFLDLYYLIPSAVAAGYSDTVYYGGFGGHWGHLYYLLPFFLGLLCVLSLVRLHPFRIAREWSRERVLLVSALVAACISFTGAFLRSDSSHLVNTMLALPVALVLAVAYLPRLLGISGRRRRLLIGLALAAVPLALLPFTQIRNVGNRIAWPIERFDYRSPAIDWQRANPDSVAAARLGDVLHTPQQWCCTRFRYPVSMREFAGMLNSIHAAVGDRRVYVANFIDGMQPGAAYFLSDLKPAPTNLEPFTMVMNERLLNEFLDYFRAHLSEVQAIVAVFPNLPEVRMFKTAYPSYRRTVIPYTWGTITVLTR
jgi:hypothetical protein